MNKLMLLACGLALLPGVAMSTDVYKWKDASGNIRYSDMPPSGNTPYSLITGKKPERAKAQEDSAAAAQADADAAKSGMTGGDKTGAASSKEIEAKKRKAEAEKQQKQEQQKQEEQKIRDQNCANAKSNLQNYKQGGRMYKFDDKGERQYLDDKDIASGLQKAQQEVDQWCN